MGYVKPEAIEKAREMDVLTYLKHYEPGNLVHISGNNYCTTEHDSLKISNGKWYWFSRGFGGVSALDYLTKVKGYPFLEAVELLVGRDAIVEPTAKKYDKKEPIERKLIYPDLVEKPYYAKKYLQDRGINSEIIQYCIDHSMIFETANYHNVVFVGYDKYGIAKYGAMRGTRSAYKGEVTGSDKRFSFAIMETTKAEHLHLFESAIDLLSYATLEHLEGRNWKQDALLSLAGVFQTKRKDVVPLALSQYLSDHPSISVIHLHLDNDEVGRGAVAGITSGLAGKYEIYDEPPAEGFKDVNEQLKAKVESDRKKEDWMR